MPWFESRSHSRPSRPPGVVHAGHFARFRFARSSTDPSPLAVIVLALLACGIAGLTQAFAGAQTLTGATLQSVETTETLVGDLLDRFVGGNRPGPRPVIERVVVQEDSPARVVVSVTYTGLANARLAGEIRGSNQRRIPQIESEPAQVTTPAGEATLVFERRASESDDGTIDSAFLWLTATETGRSSVPVVSRLFRMTKAWKGTSGAGSVSRIAPQPVGTAAQLGPRPDYAPTPPKIAVPVRVASPAVTGVVRDHRTMTRRDGAAVAGGAPAAATPPPSAAPPPSRKLPPAVLAQRRATREKTTAATQKLPPRATVHQIEGFFYGIKPEDVQKGALGPSASPIELLEGLRTEDIDVNPALLLNIASSVYPDKNPASEVFYYHPRSYHLEWTPESGHGMRILYGAATTAGTSGDVLMAARLQSGLDLSEVQLANELLKAYKRRNNSTAPPVLRPLPLEKDGLDVSLGAVLGQYSISQDKIAITGLSDVLGEIEVSWVTDPVTKENLQLALAQDVGVNGMVAFSAAGGAMAPQVPIAIQLADRDSFGRVRWNRTEGYRNVTPYPVRLRYLHALVIDPRTNLPILYSWSLGQAEVAPQSAVQWDAARVPAWIDTEAKRVWVDYSVVQSCDPCDRQVLDTITGGVTSVAAEQITFHTITPLADVGGYEITAHIRSKYFDPKDRTLLQKSVVLKADNQDFTIRPIYNGSLAAGESLFEYRLELAMPDGTIYSGTTWIPSANLRVLIGRAQLERSIGTLPGKRP